MTSFVALLRAVNVGGTGKLAMSDLKAMCEAISFQAVRTYIASGNVVFQSDWGETEVKAALETRLHAYAGRPVGVAVRTAVEMAEVSAGNPFPDAPGNRVVAIFLNNLALPSMIDDVAGRADDEELRVGRREIYVRYGNGMADTKLRIPAAKDGTARNMNTVAKLSAMAAAVFLAGCGAPAHPPLAVSCPAVPDKPISGVAEPLAPVSPIPQVMTPGHWDWTGDSYVWTPARWVSRMGSITPNWQDGYWTRDLGGCAWHNPHWVY